MPRLTKPHISWMRLASNLLSPPVIWAALVFPIAFKDAESSQQAVAWALTYGILVCAMPLVYIGWLVHRGRITDMNMSVRKERFRPLLVSIGCTTIAWWVLRFMGAPAVVPRFALFSLTQLVVMMLITLVWQISVHTMSMAGAVVAIGLLFGLLPALFMLPLLALVGVARLKLRRHTPAQVIAGTVIGAFIPLALFVIHAW